MGKPVTIDEHFAELAKPEHAGNAFMIGEEMMMERFGGDPDRMPKMPYDYRVYQDVYSGNFMILRPAADGAYAQLSDMVQVFPPAVDRELCQV